MNIAGRMISSMTEPVTAQVEVWWDRQQQLWTIQCKDAQGNQIGPVDHAPQKATAVARGNQLGAEHGCNVVVRSRADG